MLGFLPNMIWFGRVWKWGSLSPKMVLFFFVGNITQWILGSHMSRVTAVKRALWVLFFSFEEWFMKNIDQSWFVATIDVHEKPWFFYFHISSDVPSRDVENPHISWIPRIPMIFVGFVKSQRRTCHIFELWTAQHLLPLWCFMMFFFFIFYDVLWCFIMMYYDVLWCFMMYQNLSCFIIYALISPTDFPMMGLSKNRGQACPNGRAKGGEPPVLDVGEYSGISLDRMDIWYPIYEILGNIHITDEISLKYPYWLGNIWWNMFGVLGLGIWFAQLCVVLFRPWFAMLDRVVFFLGTVSHWSSGEIPRKNWEVLSLQRKQSAFWISLTSELLQPDGKPIIDWWYHQFCQSNPITIQRYFCDQTWLAEQSPIKS